jgi:4-hydroxy-tetrahydrodipicolinate synthase
VDTTDKFGLSAAMTTPFDADGSIDFRRLADHAKWCLAQGCNSVTVFGTTGEGASIGLSDREKVLGALAGSGVPHDRIIYCVAASSADEAVAQGRMAIDFGCRGLLLTPPYYFKGVSDDGLFSWHQEVVRRLGSQARGVFLYNIPSVTQISLSIELVERLKTAFPGVVTGVKDSSGNWSYTQQLLAAHADLAILIGDERYLAEGVRRGGQGAISGLANVCPDILLPLALRGKGDERISSLVDEVLKHPVTPAVKALVANRSGDPAWLAVRAPFLSLPARDAQRLASFYDRLFSAAAAE